MIYKKRIIRIVGFFIVFLIFYFLAKQLFINWEQVKAYQFSFNYPYFSTSLIFLILGMLAAGLVWKKILNFLEPENDLTYKEAVRISIYAQLGRYLPGKVLTSLGLVYLARNKKISKKNLYFSAVLAAMLPVIAAFLLSIFLLGFFVGIRDGFINFYLMGLAAVIAGLAISQPKVFKCLARFFISKIKKEDIDLDFQIGWFNEIKIIFYFCLMHFLTGLGFFFLVNSLVSLPFHNLPGLIGFYTLAGVLGQVAVFAPSGLGVAEGLLALFLQFYFPINIAILISLITRVWITLGDVFSVGLVFFYNKLMSHEK